MTTTGTGGADALSGGATADWITGLAGDDILNGGAGDDVLIGDIEDRAVLINGAQSSKVSFGPDGLVAFVGYPAVFSPGDFGPTQIFVTDLSGSLQLVSSSATGVRSALAASSPIFRPDGTGLHQVAFLSAADNLVAGDANGRTDLFLKDIDTGAITRLSTSSGGVEANGDVFSPVFSPDGTKVLFLSGATNLVAGDNNSAVDVFVRDLNTGVVTRVSTSSSDGQGNGDATSAFFIAGGAKVAFYSKATTLDPNDTDSFTDLYVKDLATGALVRASAKSDGSSILFGTDNFMGVNFSSDGQKLVFTTERALAPQDTDNGYDIYLKDLQTGVLQPLVLTSAVNFAAFSLEFSPDGQSVLFTSEAPDLVSGDTNGRTDLFLKNIATGVITRVSTDSNGGQLSGASGGGSFSADGSKIVFISDTPNLAPGDIYNTSDVFIKDLTTGELTYATTSNPAVSKGASGPVSFLSGGQAITFTDNGYTYVHSLAVSPVGADTLVGGDGADSLYGGSGDDILDGGLGDDRLDGGVGNDTVTYAGASAAVNVSLPGSSSLSDTGRSSGPYGADAFVSVENLVGSAFDDKLKGGSGASHIDGGAGNDQIGGDSSYIGSSGDVLNGGAGDDYLANGYFQETTGTASDSYNDDGGEDALDGGAGYDTASLSYVGHTADLTLDNSNPNQTNYVMAGGVAAGSITSIEALHFYGGSGSDSINAGPGGPAVLMGGAGNDTLMGGASADKLSGDAGNDVLVGGAGADTLTGGAGDDVLQGGAGNDQIYVGDGVNLVDAGDGDDVVIMDASQGFNTLTLGAGSDKVSLLAPLLANGVSAIKVLDFAAGDGGDVVGLPNLNFAPGLPTGGDPFQFGHLRFVQSGADVLLQADMDGGGDAFRTVLTLVGVQRSSLTKFNVGGAFDPLATLAPLGTVGDDNITGTAGDDLMVGYGGGDTLRGGDGQDRLYGDAIGSNPSITGADVLYGGAGADMLSGGAGDDQLFGEAGDDVLIGGEAPLVAPAINGVYVAGSLSTTGFDTYDGGSGVDRAILSYLSQTQNLSLDISQPDLVAALMVGGVQRGSLTGVEAISFSGGSGADQLTGGALSDQLQGGGGNDALRGGDGDDTLGGGLGNDLLDGGAGFDMALFSEGSLHVDLRISGPQDTGVGIDTLVSIEGLGGGNQSDQLIGNDQNNRLAGGVDGNDELSGMGGDDQITVKRMYGGSTVTLRGGDGADALSVSGEGGQTAALVFGDAGDDLISLAGGLSATVDGGAGLDLLTLSSVRRNFVIAAGAGADTVSMSGGLSATLTSVERLQFTDGYLALSTADTAASVYRLYQTMLNRTPDANGLAFWTQQIDFKGSNLKAVANGFIGSPEFNGTYGALSNDQFVELMYANVLHRASDAQGKTTWVGLLNSGGTRADVAIGFSESNENVGNLSTAIQKGIWVGNPNAGVAARFYDTVFSRLPDAPGLDTWTKALNGGASLSSVANGFVASTEFQTTYGALNNDQFVELMYQNVLGRASDQAGKTTWLNTLANGGSRADVVVGFSESAEHIRLLAPHIDDGVWVV